MLYKTLVPGSLRAYCQRTESHQRIDLTGIELKIHEYFVYHVDSGVASVGNNTLQDSEKWLWVLKHLSLAWCFLVWRLSDDLISLASSTWETFCVYFLNRIHDKGENIFGIFMLLAPQRKECYLQGRWCAYQRKSRDPPAGVLSCLATHRWKFTELSSCDRAGKTKVGQIRLCDFVEEEIGSRKTQFFSKDSWKAL